MVHRLSSSGYQRRAVWSMAAGVHRLEKRRTYLAPHSAFAVVVCTVLSTFCLKSIFSFRNFYRSRVVIAYSYFRCRYRSKNLLYAQNCWSEINDRWLNTLWQVEVLEWNERRERMVNLICYFVHFRVLVSWNQFDLIWSYLDLHGCKLEKSWWHTWSLKYKNHI